MPTSCCVVGCTNRYSKDSPYRLSVSDRQWSKATMDSCRSKGEHRRISLATGRWRCNLLSPFCLWREERQPDTPWVHSHAEYGRRFNGRGQYSKSSLSPVSNGCQLERNANVANSKKRRHKVASISVHCSGWCVCTMTRLDKTDVSYGSRFDHLPWTHGHWCTRKVCWYISCQHLYRSGAQDKSVELPCDCKLVPT